VLFLYYDIATPKSKFAFANYDFLEVDDSNFPTINNEKSDEENKGRTRKGGQKVKASFLSELKEYIKEVKGFDLKNRNPKRII